MRAPRRSRATAIGAGVLGLAMFASACGTGGSDNNDRAAGSGDASTPPGCEEYEDYQGHNGTTVNLYTSIRDQEADEYVQSYEKFEECTGIDVVFEGSGEFEAQLNVRVQGGNAPDIAFIPQPGLLQRFAEGGQAVEASEQTLQNAEEFYGEDWVGYATVDGKFYGAPNSANVKSLVWYSPTLFEEKGYEVPETWDDMIALSDKMVADGLKPWCAGVESGDATGWPATDWLEDVLLREVGPETYDQWVDHEIPFNDPQIVKSLDRVGSILKNDKYVNAGYGGVQSIVTTSFQDGGLPVANQECGMHRQASFYATQWPEGTTVAEDGDVFAFYLPPIDDSGKPVLGGGEFIVAFDDRPEVQAVQEYLSTPEYANIRAQTGPWASANQGLDPENVADPIQRLSVEILRDEDAVFRFDGSDLMPAAVGTGTFWKGMVEWLNGRSTKEVLDNIERSWPAS